MNHVKEHWNGHYIRRSRYYIVNGRPDALFYLPKIHGGSPGLLQPVPEDELSYATNQLVDKDEPNVYQEYFEFVTRECNMSRLPNWHFKIFNGYCYEWSTSSCPIDVRKKRIGRWYVKILNTQKDGGWGRGCGWLDVEKLGKIG